MKTTLYIQNLKCSGCITSIIFRLSEIKGISNISIKLQYETVTFEHESKENVEEVKQILSKIGYPPFGEKNNLDKKVKSYVSCATGKIKTHGNIT
jgi:copper chaperone CopZ